MMLFGDLHFWLMTLFFFTQPQKSHPGTMTFTYCKKHIIGVVCTTCLTCEETETHSSKKNENSYRDFYPWVRRFKKPFHTFN